MSNRDFVKGRCGHCGGHLEFPAEAGGQSIPCPHCGQTTELRAVTGSGSRKSRGGWLLMLICGLVAVAAVVLVFRPHSTGVTSPPTAAGSETNHAAATNDAPGLTSSSPVKMVDDQPRPGETVTNSFGISGGKMQKTAGTTLVNVIGTLRNLSDRQRFGVKVDYALLDSSGQVVGHATDYQSVIDPHGEWDFKALVVESKAVSARFSGITEQ